MRSTVEQIAWPAVPSPKASALLAQLYQLGQSEWWPPEQLCARQLEQLGTLARYAYQHSDFYRARFDTAGLAPGAPEVAWTEAKLRELPLLTRAQLMTSSSAINCRVVPPSHGPVGMTQTSGSTGQPVVVRRTGVSYLTWLALSMRDHIWHQRDYRQTLVAIRATTSTQDDDAEARAQGWGPPATLLYATGPCYGWPLSTDVRILGERLLARDPAYLLTYPTNLDALLSWFEEAEGDRRLRSLREVRTVGETVTPALRARCRNILGASIVDSYSSQEVGAIALQCPESGLYHVHAESLLVEVLDERGHPCPPGQVGRVVVTDLHNFATPLIRYELRDHAEVGPRCPCRRGLPTLSKVLGRRRNMVILPDGQRYWPMVGFARYRDIGPVRQYQLVQHSLHDVEMRLVTEGGSLRSEQEQRMAEVVRDALGHPFPVRFTYFEGALPQTVSGKFEEFVCLVE